jgi:hypothetical protein
MAFAVSLVALPAAACGDPGSPTAQAVPAYRTDTPWYSGLATSLRLGMLPDTYPARDIAKARSACKRADFQAGGRTWTLFNDEQNESAPPRWATAGGDRKRIAFLAFSPEPLAAYDWAKARAASGDRSGDATFKTWVWVLAVTDGDRRRIYALYDALPEDGRLIDDMQAALEGRYPALTIFDVKTADYTKDANLILPISLGAIFSKGKSAPADSVETPAAFRQGPDGQAVARASGLVCPARLEGFQRSVLTVNGPADGGFEVGCRYSGARARLAVFATYAPGRPFKDDLILAVVLLAPETFGAKPRDAPGEPLALSGAAGDLFAVNTATLPDGERRALWLRRQGDWDLAIYAYYPVDGETGVVKAASTLANATPAAP